MLRHTTLKPATSPRCTPALLLTTVPLEWWTSCSSEASVTVAVQYLDAVDRAELVRAADHVLCDRKSGCDVEVDIWGSRG
jgi:hypothetical protein